MSSRPKLVFVDHSFHKATRSSRFFSDILGERADVVELVCEGWRGGPRVSADDVDNIQADVAVFWQTLPEPTELLKLRTPAVWVPMYDSAVHSPSLFWDVLAHTGVSVLSFCRALSRTVRRYGIPVTDYTYYPDPSTFPPIAVPQEGVRVFFWDRGYIGFDRLRAVINPRRVAGTVVRRAPNPGLRPSRITARDVEDYKIRLVVGPLSQQEHLDLVASCNVFFAPRRFEGIGMTFLEAMAMGLAVVAADGPTMNEYIRHGDNGLLFDPRHPGYLDLRVASQVGARARESVSRGRQKWLRSAEGLVADILAVKPRPAAPSRRVAALAAVLTAGERAKSLVPPAYRAALTEAVRRGTSR